MSEARGEAREPRFCFQAFLPPTFLETSNFYPAAPPQHHLYPTRVVGLLAPGVTAPALLENVSVCHARSATPLPSDFLARGTCVGDAAPTPRPLARTDTPGPCPPRTWRRSLPRAYDVAVPGARDPARRPPLTLPRPLTPRHRRSLGQHRERSERSGDRR